MKTTTVLSNKNPADFDRICRFLLSVFILIPVSFASIGCSDSASKGKLNDAKESGELPKLESQRKDNGISLESKSQLVSAFPDSEYEAGRAISLLDVPPMGEESPCYFVLNFGGGGDAESIRFICAVGQSSIYVDLDRSGEFDGGNETFPLEETSAYGGIRNTRAIVSQVSAGEDVHTDLEIKIGRPIAISPGKTSETIKATVSIKLWGRDESTTGANLVPLRLRANSRVAPVVHFGGSLKMGVYREFESLTVGEQTNFYTLIGTQGEGVGTLTAIDNTEIPDDAHPQAKFIFPHKDPSQPPIVVNSILETRC